MSATQYLASVLAAKCAYQLPKMELKQKDELNNSDKLEKLKKIAKEFNVKEVCGVSKN